MYLKRYLFALFLYFAPYVLLVQWVLSDGARPNEAHAIAQVLIVPLYAALSLYLVVVRPQPRFAFDSTPRRIMRWVLYLVLYGGLVLLPALLLLHADSDGFHIPLAVPFLLFLGMLFTPEMKEKPDGEEIEEIPADDSPRRWLTYYGLYLATPLAGGLLVGFLVPRQHLALAVLLLSLAVMIMAIWMIYRLTVSHPNVRFANLTPGQRRNRFWVHAGLYLGMVLVLPRVLEVLFGKGPAMDTWLMLPLLTSAAYGRGMLSAGLRLRPRKPKPRPETRDERLQRRMRELRAKYSPGR